MLEHTEHLLHVHGLYCETIEYAEEQIFRGSTEAVKLRMKMSGRQVKFTSMCKSKIDVSTEIGKLKVASQYA